MSIYGNNIFLNEGLFFGNFSFKNFNKELFFEDKLKDKESILLKDNETDRYNLTHPKDKDMNILGKVGSIHYKFININGYLGVIGEDYNKDKRAYSLEMIDKNYSTNTRKNSKLMFDMRKNIYAKYFK